MRYESMSAVHGALIIGLSLFLLFSGVTTCCAPTPDRPPIVLTQTGRATTVEAKWECRCVWECRSNGRLFYQDEVVSTNDDETAAETSMRVYLHNLLEFLDQFCDDGSADGPRCDCRETYPPAEAP